MTWELHCIALVGLAFPVCNVTAVQASSCTTDSLRNPPVKRQLTTAGLLLRHSPTKGRGLCSPLVLTHTCDSASNQRWACAWSWKPKVKSLCSSRFSLNVHCRTAPAVMGVRVWGGVGWGETGCTAAAGGPVGNLVEEAARYAAHSSATQSHSSPAEQLVLRGAQSHLAQKLPPAADNTLQIYILHSPAPAVLPCPSQLRGLSCCPHPEAADSASSAVWHPCCPAAALRCRRAKKSCGLPARLCLHMSQTCRCTASHAS